jgi:signal transduction histidine kinase
VAVGLAFLLDPLVHQSVFVVFLGAVTVSAWFGGVVPGLLATMLGGFAFTFFLTEPAYSLVISGSGITTDLAIFGIVSMLINGLYVRLRHAKRREEAARKEAEAAIRLRDGFLAAAAHDLSNPLTAILGICAMWKQRLRRENAHNAESCASAKTAIESNARRLQAQIDQLLDVASSEAGRPLPLRRTRSDLVGLVEEVVASRGASSLRHDVRFETDVEQLMASFDSARLERVIENLLVNAVKYSPLGGQIVVRLRREEGAAGAWAVLTVHDEGLGVPSAEVGRIFEPFRRASNVGPISGTGIGLASARQIVEQHGGTIEVISREGAGSTFTVRLPVEPHADAPTPPRSATDARQVVQGRSH